METKRERMLGLLCSVLFLVIFLWGIDPIEAQTIAKVIDKTNYKEHRDLLIPAQLRALESGEWTFPTGKLDFPFKHWDRFLVAGEKNAGKYNIDARGNLVDRSTGKFPTHNVYGFPFPKIDPKDPKVAEKIMWNFKFQLYSLMGFNNWGKAQWVGKGGGEERYVAGPNIYLFYQGRRPGEEMKNPKGFIYNDIYIPQDPMGIKGTILMTLEYMDERDTTVWSYIPAIRRARLLSGASRSDPSYGSDGWYDRALMWSGKNSSFKWKFLGERMVLASFTTTDKEIAQEAQDGTVTLKSPLVKFGYETKGWKGATWASTTATWIPRSVWVVEGYPKDPYYNFGKEIFYVDKETYNIWQLEAFDKALTYWKWTFDISHYAEAPSGTKVVGLWDASIVIDDKVRHGTVTRFRDAQVFISKSRLNSSQFTVSHMLSLSK